MHAAERIVRRRNLEVLHRIVVDTIQTSKVGLLMGEKGLATAVPNLSSRRSVDLIKVLSSRSVNP